MESHTQQLKSLWRELGFEPRSLTLVSTLCRQPCWVPFAICSARGVVCLSSTWIPAFRFGAPISWNLQLFPLAFLVRLSVWHSGPPMWQPFLLLVAVLPLCDFFSQLQNSHSGFLFAFLFFPSLFFFFNCIFCAAKLFYNSLIFLIKIQFHRVKTMCILRLSAWHIPIRGSKYVCEKLALIRTSVI